jgi:WD40 repeat protein
VAFRPDGRTLASASYKEIKLWDVTSDPPAEVATLSGHSGWVNSVAFRPDGRTLASASYQTIKLWDLRFKEWRKALCRKVNRNLTMTEWRTYMGSSRPYEKTCPGLPEHPSVAEAGG